MQGLSGMSLAEDKEKQSFNNWHVDCYRSFPDKYVVQRPQEMLMKMKALVLACLCAGLWACGAVTESPRVAQPASDAVQETQQANKEKKTKEPSMENLEDDCD